jgi:hypothetical protein
LQAVIGDDALNRTNADGPAALAELLRYDLSRGVRIQEELTQDLADGLFGAAIVGLGAGFAGLERGQAAALEGVEQLIITLTAEAVFLGHSEDVLVEALAFQEHEETARQGVVRGDGQRAGWAGELVGGGVELE